MDNFNMLYTMHKKTPSNFKIEGANTERVDG